MDYLPLIIQLVSGAIGGVLAGKLLNNLSLGVVGNSLVGMLGGALGGQLLGLLELKLVGVVDAAAVIGSFATGSVGGGILLVLIGTVKKVFSH